MKPLARRAAVGAIAAVVTLGLTALPAGATSEWDLDHSGAPDGPVGPLGNPNTATYGQTFTVPEGPDTLESFSVEVALPPTLVFRAAIQAWDDAAMHATGTELYLSAPTSTTGLTTETLTFTPDIAIAPGTYVLYLTTSHDWTPAANSGSLPRHGTDPYAGGGFFYLNNGADLAGLTTTGWTAIPAFDMVFTVVFDGPVAPPTDPPAPPAPPAPPVTGNPAFTG